ncbi:hypothetical protein CRYUN_Cryun36dG0019400 [Craigia yunnanensis]
MSQANVDFSLKETSPNIGGGRVSGSEKLTSSFDLVEQLHFLYVKMVRARDLPGTSCNPFVEVKIDRIQAVTVEVTVRNKDTVNDDVIGRLGFDITDIPSRVPPDSPLAPQWYSLEDKDGRKGERGELMLAIWMGTQADEVFPDAWHSDEATVSGESIANTRSKVYISPRLWYLRVNIIQAQDLVPINRNRNPEVYVKAMLGNMVLRSRFSPDKSINPKWNEDLMFVVAEPFDDPLMLTVVDKLGNNKEDILGRLHLRVCLDGGYHVLDESIYYSSDFRATSKSLWPPTIGVLVGVRNLECNWFAANEAKDGRGTTDAYCVAKYGPKWVRTRTIIDSFAPKWNEQYTWEVYDPYTVITIGVFDNCHLQGGSNTGGSEDPRIGKVRIRLSTLNADRIYTHSYPLKVLQPNGVKKMGEIQLAVRFTCSSTWNLFQSYTQPLFPQMHYLLPLSLYQVESLRHQATHTLWLRLCRAEPPLRREIVEYMLDVCFNFFSSVSYMEHPKYRKRPRHPPHMDTKLFLIDSVHSDELDEEFDTFPSSKNGEVLKKRYDRLRSIAGRLMTIIGDLATQAERFNSMLSWRDPRATPMFLAFCLFASIAFYFIPGCLFALGVGFFAMRHPRFRISIPSLPQNFFRRLPARTDSMI